MARSRVSCERSDGHIIRTCNRPWPYNQPVSLPRTLVLEPAWLYSLRAKSFRARPASHTAPPPQHVPHHSRILTLPSRTRCPDLPAQPSGPRPFSNNQSHTTTHVTVASPNPLYSTHRRPSPAALSSTKPESRWHGFAQLTTMPLSLLRRQWAHSNTGHGVDSIWCNISSEGLASS